MLFNSIEFAIFLPVVFLLYWTVFNKKSVMVRNIFLLVCSYSFYAFWNWKFLGLIFISSLTDFIIGGKIFGCENQKKRKLLLAVSLFVNLGILCFFKYANFFIESFADMFTLFGAHFQAQHLSIILPVGISFYTFQTISYSIDIYRRKMEPTKDPIAFFAFISFFPQLVAGPIERANHLLPQFSTLKKFDYENMRKGIVDIFIGLFKKMVIADRLAIYIDSVYGGISSGTQTTGMPVLLAVIFFSFQLYIDFSAYSQIAIGTARLLGFELVVNFRRPYLSKSFSGFWDRWHISLSKWMCDYIFIPLGGSREGKWKTWRNLLIVFAVSGLWHGASWNFVIWGVLNGLFLVMLNPLLEKMPKKASAWVNPLIVWSLWTLSLVFFRSPDFGTSMLVFKSLGFGHAATAGAMGMPVGELIFSICMIVVLMIFECLAEKDKLHIPKANILRWSFYTLLVLSIILFGIYATNNDNSFIYFQF